MGVAKTEKALRAEVTRVCRTYCLQVWYKALDWVRVEASSALRRVESVYYPPTIQASSSLGPKADTTSKEANTGNESLAKSLPQSKAHPRRQSCLKVLKS